MVPPPFGAGHGSHDVLHLFSHRRVCRNATAESSYAGISENELLRQTAAAISVEVCGRLGLPMPPDAFQTLEGMRDHIPDGEERRTLEKVREMAVTFGDAVCKRLKLERGQPAPQQEER